MMSQRAILVLCRDASRFARVSRALDAGLRPCLRGLTHLDDVRTLLEAGGTGLILCVVDPGDSLDTLDHLLWVVSSLWRRPPVLVLAEHYEPEQATTAFRMGAYDYLTFDDHAGNLSGVVGDLLCGKDGESFVTSSAPPEAYRALTRVR